MLPFNNGKNDVYGPDTLKVMGAAFDAAVQSIPPHLQNHDRAPVSSVKRSYCPGTLHPEAQLVFPVQRQNGDRVIPLPRGFP